MRFWLHVVNLSGSPGLGHQYSQHYNALTSTSREPLQGDPGKIPCRQKRIGVDKCHQVLGNLFSLAIALPGTRGIFIHMQEYVHHVDGKHVALTRSVNQALADFQWLAKDLGQCPTRLYGIVHL